jgi:hypothetical protein
MRAFSFRDPYRELLRRGAQRLRRVVNVPDFAEFEGAPDLPLVKSRRVGSVGVPPYMNPARLNEVQTVELALAA